MRVFPVKRSKVTAVSAPSVVQGSRLESTAPTRSWRLSRALCLWSDSFTTWESSRRTQESPRRRKEKLCVSRRSVAVLETFHASSRMFVFHSVLSCVLCPAGGVRGQRDSRPAAAAGQCRPGARSPHPPTCESPEPPKPTTDQCIDPSNG